MMNGNKVTTLITIIFLMITIYLCGCISKETKDATSNNLSYNEDMIEFNIIPSKEIFERNETIEYTLRIKNVHTQNIKIEPFTFITYKIFIINPIGNRTYFNDWWLSGAPMPLTNKNLIELEPNETYSQTFLSTYTEYNLFSIPGIYYINATYDGSNPEYITVPYWNFVKSNEAIIEVI